MGYHKESFLKRYEAWKTRYEANGGTDPCLHTYLEETGDNDIPFCTEHTQIIRSKINQDIANRRHGNIVATA